MLSFSRHARNFRWAVICVVFCGACRRGPSDGIISGPMVQMVTPTGFTVVWNRQGPPSKCAATAVGEAGEEHSATSFTQTDDGRSVAVFDGLAPDTVYEYRICADAKDTPFVTRTAPLPTRPEEAATRLADFDSQALRILAFGDSGEGGSEQYDLAKLMEKQNPHLIVHTGDLVYPDGLRSDYRDKFFRPYASLISSVPFYPCPGNHDVRTESAAPLFEEFVLPENGPPGDTPERDYWFDYGDVRFVSIDTNVYQERLRDVIAPWLDRVLADSNARWKVCFFHHPVYTNAKYGPTRKLWNTIVPVMEKRGVQLVLSGHDHLYERTLPIRRREIVEPGRGIVYVTTGAGGAELYSPKEKQIPEIPVAYNERHSFTIVDVTWDEMRLKQINSEGKTPDEFVIPHGAQSDASNRNPVEKRETVPTG